MHLIKSLFIFTVKMRFYQVLVRRDSFITYTFSFFMADPSWLATKVVSET